MRKVLGHGDAALEIAQQNIERLTDRVRKVPEHMLHLRVRHAAFKLRLVVYQQEEACAAGADDLEVNLSRCESIAVFAEPLRQIGI